MQSPSICFEAFVGLFFVLVFELLLSLCSSTLRLDGRPLGGLTKLKPPRQ